MHLKLPENIYMNKVQLKKRLEREIKLKDYLKAYIKERIN